MLIGRGTRRIVAIVLLISMAGFVGVFGMISQLPKYWEMLGQARWLLLTLIAIAVVSNVYRLWERRHAPKPPPAKPRPSHLKLVRTDETLH